MDPHIEHQTLLGRRVFLEGAGAGIGMAALGSLLGPQAIFANETKHTQREGLPGLPYQAPKARRVIYLCQSGAPSQLDLFDYKPNLEAQWGKELPDSVRQGQRLTGMTSGQDSLPIAPSLMTFSQHGDSGAWLSELIPHTAQIVDRICIIKSMFTEAINHDPAITFMQTGTQLAGRPSMGAWLSYGLGSENEELPTFVAITSGDKGQPLYDRLWGSGFLPSRHQGVRFRSKGDPVLYLSNPPGLDTDTRREMLDDLAQLNRFRLDRLGDPEISTRIAQYEMAFRMQKSIPELTDISQEPESTFRLYGDDARSPGTFAANCLLARRLTERGVRFIQLYHRGWDHHTNLPRDIRKLCGETDQASAALVADLAQRGMLDETLVIWGGEFGRTVYCQEKLTATNYGRDHHPRCFTLWLAGGGIRPGMTYGETDDHSYNIVQNPVSLFDLNATILHCLGIDHTRLTFKYQGRHHRLTDVHGEVMEPVLA